MRAYGHSLNEAAKSRDDLRSKQFTQKLLIVFLFAVGLILFLLTSWQKRSLARANATIAGGVTEWSSLVNPGMSIPPFVQGLTGITNEMVAGAPTGRTAPPGAWQQISIFLSPMDVHVNRMPVGGRVAKVLYHPGRFLPAYQAEAGDLNEYTEVWIDTGGQTIVFRQIVGILARRIVCRVREGDVVKPGDRFGVMKFGSRMDLFLPPNASIRVAAGDRVVGGVSVIAELAS